MIRLKCFFVILLLTVMRKELLHASGKYQCLTWDLYNDENIRFICRVSSFVKPITLTDNHGKLFAQCTFYEKVKSCQPSMIDSFVQVNYTTNDVIFNVDRESVWLYDGEWSCHVGREIFISNVSISKGILNDTTVKLESSIRNTNIIELKCSSCQVPISLNAEFQINGISAHNIFYDRGSDKCIHHGVPCQSDVCGCSASGNEFSIQLNTNTSRHKSFACDLMFKDPVTGTKFSKIAEIKFNGTDYIQAKTQTKVIKQGKPRDDERVSFLPSNIVTTVTNDRVNSTALSAAKNGQYYKGHPLQWITIGVMLALVTCLAVFLIKRRCRNYLFKRIRFLPNKTMRYENENEASAETSLLMNEGTMQGTHNNDTAVTDAEITCRVVEVYEPTDEGYTCEPCLKQGQRTDAYEYCINCDEQYCRRCQMSHLSMKMTSKHALIEISKLLCDNHGKREYTHICLPHKILICGQCLKSRHPRCHVKAIMSFKSSNISIKSDDIYFMRNTINQTFSTPNLLDLCRTSEQQPKKCFEKNYFQTCLKAVSTLRKENIQPKSRISFKTKDMESSFYMRKTKNDFFMTM